MTTISEYIIVPSTDADHLEKLVNDKIKTGYEPFGNLVVVEMAGGFRMLQPMVTKTHDLMPPRTR